MDPKVSQKINFVRSTTAPSTVTAGIALPAALCQECTTLFVPRGLCAVLVNEPDIFECEYLTGPILVQIFQQ